MTTQKHFVDNQPTVTFYNGKMALILVGEMDMS